jgi:PleD family two-component response regulator
MATIVRETDMVARWGGDELLVVMPDTATRRRRQVAGPVEAARP